MIKLFQESSKPMKEVRKEVGMLHYLKKKRKCTTNGTLNQGRLEEFKTILLLKKLYPKVVTILHVEDSVICKIPYFLQSYV